MSKLESEIELDKMRANGMSGSMKRIEKKEALLSDMKSQSMDLTSDIGQEILEAYKVIDENNELASMQPVEESNSSIQTDINLKGDSKNESDKEFSDKAE